MGAVVDFLKETPVLPMYLTAKKAWKRLQKIYLLRILCPRAYNKYKKYPVEEDKVVFIEVRHPGITNSFQELYDTLAKEYHFRLHSHFLQTNFVSDKEFRQRCCDMLQDIATAKYVFINDGCNVVGCLSLRPETILVQTWHGCGAFKKFGYSTAELIFGDSRKEMDRFPNHKNYTYVTVSSPEVIWAYEEALHLENQPGVVVATGSSRTDIFYREEFRRKAKERLLTIMPSAAGKKVILYAPTFRGRVAKAKMPNMLDVPRFREALGEEYVLLIKHHPLVKKPPVVPQTCQDFALNVTNAMSIEELICVSDICISDYSSMVFEFSLFEKPMLFYSFDLDEYFDWRGFYYDYYELAPGPVFTTNWEMIDYIRHVEERFDKQRVIDFRNKFMSSCDGHATEKILKLAIGEEMLEKYRREEPLAGSFYKIPGASDGLYRKRTARLNQMRMLADKAPSAYRAACKGDVNHRKIVMVTQQKGDTAIWKPLKNLLEKKDGVLCELVKVSNGKDFSVESFYRTIGDAAYVLLLHSCPPVNAVEIRPETKVIQMGYPSFPLQRTDYASKKVRSGYLDDELQILPLHRNYDTVVVESECAAAAAAEDYAVKPEICRVMGSLSLDRLQNKGIHKRAVKKLKEKEKGLFPEIGERKIILYMPVCRDALLPPVKPVLLNEQYLFEYLKDEYAVIYYFDVPEAVRPKLRTYFNNSLRDLTGQMPLYELIAAADVVVGDYRQELFEAAAAGKPVFLYTPDKDTYLEPDEERFGFDEVLPGVEVTDTMDLIEKLGDLEHYDAANQERFNKQYMGYCDGKTAQRVAEWLSEQMNG